MSKISLNPNSTQYILLCISILIILSFTLHPVVAKQLFNRKLWINYLDRIQTQQSINPKEFWKTREFSANGRIIFSDDGISIDLIPRDIKTIYNLLKTKKFQPLPFLLFQSNTLNSLDILIDESFLTSFNNNMGSITFKHQNLANNIYIAKDAKQKLIYLVFIQPTDSLRQANGFFDYAAHDKNVDTGKIWLNITSYSYRKNKESSADNIQL